MLLTVSTTVSLYKENKANNHDGRNTLYLTDILSIRPYFSIFLCSDIHAEIETTTKTKETERNKYCRGTFMHAELLITNWFLGRLFHFLPFCFVLLFVFLFFFLFFLFLLFFLSFFLFSFFSRLLGRPEPPLPPRLLRPCRVILNELLWPYNDRGTITIFHVNH